jgi:hypothetical protein
MSAREITTLPPYGEKRPVRTAEQERLMMLGWVRAVRSEVDQHHVSQGKLSKLEFHLSQPPFPVAKTESEIIAETDGQVKNVLFFAVGATCIVIACKWVETNSIGAMGLGIFGCVMCGLSGLLC